MTMAWTVLGMRRSTVLELLLRSGQIRQRLPVLSCA